MVRVLTLGTGLVGNAVNEAFSADDAYEVASTNRSGSADYTMNISTKSEVEAVIENFKPDIVINAAQVAGRGACDQNPERANRVNVTGASVLAEVMGQIVPGAHLAQLSSVAVFSGEKEGAYLESDQPDSETLYGETLRAGEQIVTAARVSSTVFRAPHVIGLRSSEREDQGISTQLCRAINGEIDFTAYDNNHLSPISPSNLAEEIKFALEHQIGINEAVHVSGAYLGSTADLARLVAEKIGKPLGERLHIMPSPEGYRINSVLEAQKIKDHGFVPPTFDPQVDFIY